MIFHLLLLDGSILEIEATDEANMREQAFHAFPHLTHRSQLVLIREDVNVIHDTSTSTWRCLLTPHRRVNIGKWIEEERVVVDDYATNRGKYVRECTNESILAHFLSLPQGPYHLFSNPYEMVADRVLEYLIHRDVGTRVDYPLVIPALANPNDRVVDYFLSEGGICPTICSFPHIWATNPHPRVGEWIDRYAVSGQVWLGLDYLPYLLHPHVSYETVSEILTHISPNRFVSDVWDETEPTLFPTVLVRALLSNPTYDEYLSNTRCISTTVVLAKCGKYDHLHPWSFPAPHWSMLFPMPVDELVEKWITHFSHTPHSNWMRAAACAANPHPKMVEWTINLIHTLESDPNDRSSDADIDEILSVLARNPNPDAVAFVTDRLRQDPDRIELSDLALNSHPSIGPMVLDVLELESARRRRRRMSLSILLCALRFSDVEVMF